MWLIADHVAQELRAARAALPAATGDQRAAFDSNIAQIKAAIRDSGPRSLSIAGDTAEIRVEGVLTEQLDFWLWLMDEPNTAYEDVRAAIATAESDASIRKVVFYVDSPGGNIDGLFETIAAIQGMSKPSSVRSRCACSAAYAIAAVAGKIEAVNHAAMFGSVGVVVSYVLWDAVKVIDITSTEAPEKRPDPETPDGQASIRKLLDAVHALMAEGIAAGRGTSVEIVNASYGRGAVMLAAEAKKAGMIDRIAGKRPGETGQARALADLQESLPAPSVAAEISPTKATDNTGAEEKFMDLKTLKTQHVDVYDAVIAEGIAQERKRCRAHVTMARKPGCTDIALKAIEEGQSFGDEELLAAYMSASMDGRDVSTRQEESNDAAKAIGGGTKNQEQQTLLDRAADAYCGAKKD